MYNFKSLKASYKIHLTHQWPDFTLNRYSSRMMVSARRCDGHYEFTLENRINVRLDGKPPAGIMDCLMMQLGNSLFPLTLQVSDDGKLYAVKNIEEVKQRWHKEADEMLKTHSTTEFKTYLEMASGNVAGEKQLVRSLAKDSFIQLFFLSYGSKVLEIDWFNFPRPGQKTTCYARRKADELNYILSPAFNDDEVEQAAGTLSYRKFPSGELENMKATFYLSTREGKVYRKGVTLVVDPGQRQVKTGLFL